MVRLLCFALLLSQVPLVAQDKPLRLAEIRTLLDLGAETTEIIAFCKQESRQWELSAADLATLEKEGADDRLLTWLRAQMPTPTPGEIDAKILIERHQAGATEAELLTLIDQAVKRSPPSLSDLLAMDGAGIP
ncbi:MAG: hypothetical protein KDB53_10020, partial [Planctomycetes bacterium]|nr:hypothetical protein [Planctomycetota bacterium]